jgi:Sushi repeat (SCR repeat)
VETTKILSIQQRIDDNDTVTHSVDDKGMLSKCFTLSQYEPLVAHLTNQRRLSGVRITSGTSKSDVIFFQRANFKFTGRRGQIPSERTYSKKSVSSFVFKNSNQRTSQSVEIVSTKSFELCQLEMYALVDHCGHPEIPINGTVTWQRGSTIATYSCHEGYALEPKTTTRTCHKGKWSGSEPLCKFLNGKASELC